MNIREDLKAFLDGELTEERMAEVRSALDTDASLRAEVEEMQKITQSIKSTAKDIPVHGFDEAMSKVAKPPRPIFKALRYAAGFSVLVVCLGVLYPLTVGSKASDESVAFNEAASSPRPRAALPKLLLRTKLLWNLKHLGFKSGPVRTRWLPLIGGREALMKKQRRAARRRLFRKLRTSGYPPGKGLHTAISIQCSIRIVW